MPCTKNIKTCVYVLHFKFVNKYEYKTEKKKMEK